MLLNKETEPNYTYTHRGIPILAKLTPTTHYTQGAAKKYKENL